MLFTRVPWQLHRCPQYATPSKLRSSLESTTAHPTKPQDRRLARSWRRLLWGGLLETATEESFTKTYSKTTRRLGHSLLESRSKSSDWACSMRELRGVKPATGSRQKWLPSLKKEPSLRRSLAWSTTLTSTKSSSGSAVESLRLTGTTTTTALCLKVTQSPPLSPGKTQTQFSMQLTRSHSTGLTKLKS